MGNRDPKLVRDDATGLYDFEIVGGNPVLTDDQSGPAIRLLRQREWIGDDGERRGPAVDDVDFASLSGVAAMRSIIETRLQVLVSMGRWESFDVQRVERDGGRIDAVVTRTLPGQLPETTRIRVRDF